ncbi:hypothetical protein SAY86_008565 [Trapa natans]|uniref:Uncharacterized protein n=1 Tax=Trapa natans TaxID=22666 RepID=A0AAN7QB75_TRANT|nr:hypothetical protein SAY86_008565 [Trapa natans]
MDDILGALPRPANLGPIREHKQRPCALVEADRVPPPEEPGGHTRRQRHHQYPTRDRPTRNAVHTQRPGQPKQRSDGASWSQTSLAWAFGGRYPHSQSRAGFADHMQGLGSLCGEAVSSANETMQMMAFPTMREGGEYNDTSTSTGCSGWEAPSRGCGSIEVSPESHPTISSKFGCSDLYYHEELSQ